MRKILSGLLPALLLSHASAHASHHTEAWAIAASNLYSNTITLVDENGDVKRFLLAGANQYKSLWSRDFSTATAGALLAGHFSAVKDSLEIIFQYQRYDGLIPRGIDRVPIEQRVVLGLAGQAPEFDFPLKGWFKTEYGQPGMDGNALIPWAASQYVLKARDKKFARRYFDKARLALAYIKKNHWVDGLVGKQPPFSDWQDSIKRTGRVAVTNAHYILSLKGMAKWARFIGVPELGKQFEAEAAAATEAFNTFFWDETSGRLTNFEGDGHLVADANLMAVVHKLVSPERSKRIMQTLRASALWRPLPGLPTTPPYPDSMKGTNLWWGGIKDYFDGMYWLWITSLAARAELAVGNTRGYCELMDQLSALISRDGKLGEVYVAYKDGSLSAVSRALYRSEEPFTWSSAMYLEAAVSLPKCGP